jgi:hypothetical protein
LAFIFLYDIHMHILMQVRVENLPTPEDYIGDVLHQVKKDYLVRTYEVDDWQSPTDFLEQLARKSGRLLKGGEPDTATVAKSVLYDWQRGKLPWFVLPPASDADPNPNPNADSREPFKEEVSLLHKSGADPLPSLPFPKRTKLENSASNPSPSTSTSSSGNASEISLVPVKEEQKQAKSVDEKGGPSKGMVGEQHHLIFALAGPSPSSGSPHSDADDDTHSDEDDQNSNHTNPRGKKRKRKLRLRETTVQVKQVFSKIPVKNFFEDDPAHRNKDKNENENEDDAYDWDEVLGSVVGEEVPFPEPSLPPTDTPPAAVLAPTPPHKDPPPASSDPQMTPTHQAEEEADRRSPPSPSINTATALLAKDDGAAAASAPPGPHLQLQKAEPPRKAFKQTHTQDDEVQFIGEIHNTQRPSKTQSPKPKSSSKPSSPPTNCPLKALQPKPQKPINSPGSKVASTSLGASSKEKNGAAAPRHKAPPQGRPATAGNSPEPKKTKTKRKRGEELETPVKQKEPRMTTNKMKVGTHFYDTHNVKNRNRKTPKNAPNTPANFPKNAKKKPHPAH